MSDYFYKVYTEYYDDEIVYGYFRSFAGAYAASADYNEECGNEIPDDADVWEEIKRDGTSYIGRHTIERIKYSD